MARPLTIFFALVAMAMAGARTDADMLTFDGLPSVYTNFNGYQENGYDFSMTLGSGGFQAHIGDGTNIADTLNWHDAGDNGYGNYMTMTQIGGGAFDLYDLDVQGDYVNVAGLFTGLGQGHHILNIRGVTSLVFTTGYAGIDNVNVSPSAVPEIDPAGMGSVLAVVAGALGLLERRRLRAA